MPPKKDTKGGAKEKPKASKGGKSTDEGIKFRCYVFLTIKNKYCKPVGAASKEKKGGNAVKVRHILCEKQGKV